MIKYSDTKGNFEKNVLVEQRDKEICLRLSAKESAELNKIRKEIKEGKTISEKELFSILLK